MKRNLSRSISSVKQNNNDIDKAEAKEDSKESSKESSKSTGDGAKGEFKDAFDVSNEENTPGNN